MSEGSAEHGLQILTLSKTLPSWPFLGCPEELKIEKAGIAPCNDEQR